MAQAKPRPPYTVGVARRLLKDAKRDLRYLTTVMQKSNPILEERAGKRLDKIRRVATHFEALLASEHLEASDKDPLSHVATLAFEFLVFVTGPDPEEL